MPLGGLKLYFPNIIFKLVRSNLPPHQQVFHFPQSVNKFDVKDLIQKLYQVTVTDVRTMNMLGRRPKLVLGRKRGGKPGFKKVIVTMKEDFVFPPPPSVQENGAIAIPPMTGKGKNSANHNRALVERQARERESLGEKQA
ncbi:hypothetical protein HDV03_004814 [Kappamyces sp. JEL0829]|nr:hypothetical protein HDV03_004814 [Kappamyces sp. JEL0829]